MASASANASATVDRRRPIDYFQAASTLLRGEGPAALTTTGLCAHLMVTRGSFYHHFPTLDAFVEAYLGHLERELAPALWALIESFEDPRERIGILKRTAVANQEILPPLRVWATTDHRVAALVARLDLLHEQRLATTYEAAGLEPRRAQLFAQIGYRIMVGDQHVAPSVDGPDLGALFDEYERWLLHAVDETTTTCHGTADHDTTSDGAASSHHHLAPPRSSS